jgi:hypothetical protein
MRRGAREGRGDELRVGRRCLVRDFVVDDNMDLDASLGNLLEDVIESVLLLGGSSHVEFGREPTVETVRSAARLRQGRRANSIEKKGGTYHQS